MAGTDVEHCFLIGSGFADAADLAETVGHLCLERSGGDTDLADSLRLCMAEALNNIVEHAYQGASGLPIRATLRFAADAVGIELMDEGRPMPGGRLPAGDLDFDPADTEALPEGGFGWMLIRAEMDQVEYERCDNCNLLRLKKVCFG